MENQEIKELLIEQYGHILSNDTCAFHLHAKSEENLLEVNTTKTYIMRDMFDGKKDVVPDVNTLLQAFVLLCQQAKVFVDEDNVNAQFIGCGENKFDFIRIPIRGVVVSLALLPSPQDLGAVELPEQKRHCFAIVHVCRDDSEIQSQGNEFVSQTLNMETGQVHTCLFRMGVTTDQPLFPSYVPVMVSPKGYNHPQDAVDNQAEDMKSLIPVADFTNQ